MSKIIIGVDIGGMSIKLGAVNEAKEILYRFIARTPTKVDDNKFLLSLEKFILEVILQFNSAEKLLGIGIGSPGPINIDRGIIYQTANLNSLKFCKVKAFLEKKFGVNVYLQNDASCAALGHKFFGLGKKKTDFAVITLGAGVGGGLVLNDNLFTGYQGNGFEIGHVPVTDNYLLGTKYHVKCGCGSMGCLETFASAASVVKMYNFFQKIKKRKKNIQFPKEVSALAGKNDIIAKKVFKIVGRSLGLSVVYLIQALNLPLIIFTGGLSVSSHLFAEEIESTVRERVLPMLYSRLKVKYVIENKDFSILGAASLCFQLLKKD